MADTALVGERIRIDVCAGVCDPEVELAALRGGLLRNPPEISSKYFYDDRGSRIFDRICELPEYYQTRTELALLTAIADDVVRKTGAEEVVELGPGASTKARVLLDAMQRAGQLELYVPFDVNEGIVRRVAEELTGDYPSLSVHGVAGEFMTHLDCIPDGGRRLVLFLGGTIGNFEPPAAAAFLGEVAALLDADDALLLGTDLIKDVDMLEAAYDDAQGVTAAFNLNILAVMNELVGADFVPERFAHRAPYVAARHRIEMRLRSLEDQVVRLPALDLTLGLPRGKEIRTEVSTKFDRELVRSLLREGGFTLEEWFTDREQLFGLALARPAR
jgi:L-histidine N-alpha-methyltransferase